MSEAGFLAQTSKSPVSLLAVIALHGAAITALALSRMDVPVVKVFTPLEIKPVPVEPDPPPVPVEPTKTKQTPALVDSMKPLVDLPPQPDSLVRPEPDRIIPIEPIPNGPIVVDMPHPPAPPVRIEPEMRAGIALQPPYPASERRMNREGTVTIRLLIGADGRVKSAEKVRATSEAFYSVTERHALSRWRFRPATLDGKPVESRKILTVHFRLNG
ncbi:TonB family protein [Allosphingosinicella sp.]|uniref:energy transducer TonB n=1 Tax=Allosphingosinicella sp. TaxID=2823234 RepID=UPI002FC15A73